LHLLPGILRPRGFPTRRRDVFPVRRGQQPRRPVAPLVSGGVRPRPRHPLPRHARELHGALTPPRHRLLIEPVMKNFPALPTWLAVLASLLLPATLPARELPQSALPNYVPWPEETVHAFENLLIQQDGRVKPVYTVARFTLLQFLGKSKVSFQTQDGEKHRLHYSAWYL